MGRQRNSEKIVHAADAPPLLTTEQWRAVVEAMDLSPQQGRIVGLILQNRQDKQIAAELGLSRETVRTYLKRIFLRLGVEGRLGLVLRVFTICLNDGNSEECPSYG